MGFCGLVSLRSRRTVTKARASLKSDLPCPGFHLSASFHLLKYQASSVFKSKEKVRYETTGYEELSNEMPYIPKKVPQHNLFLS